MSKIHYYAQAEAPAIMAGERLLPLRAVAERWGVSERQVRKWARGRRADGLVLAAFRPTRKIIRFRLADVLAFEHGAGLGQ